jgi:hypothetical protein
MSVVDLHQRLRRRYLHCGNRLDVCVYGGNRRRPEQGPGALRGAGAFVNENQKKRGGRITAFAQWLAGASASTVVQKALWLIPLMQTIRSLEEKMS